MTDLKPIKFPSEFPNLELLLLNVLPPLPTALTEDLELDDLP